LIRAGNNQQGFIKLITFGWDVVANDLSINFTPFIYSLKP
jgi:hypothetical protein